MTGFQWVAESAPLPGFVIRATVVLATGIALAWLMRKRSARVRHGLWTATLLLLLLLPALTFWAPQWKVPLLPVATRPAAEAEAMRLPVTSRAESAAASASGGRQHGVSALGDHDHCAGAFRPGEKPCDRVGARRRGGIGHRTGSGVGRSTRREVRTRLGAGEGIRFGTRRQARRRAHRRFGSTRAATAAMGDRMPGRPGVSCCRTPPLPHPGSAGASDRGPPLDP